ncbi:hypothetical protein SAMN05192558_102110 [Actinokineospora alba]|uniref:Uncharacterized protein n=1 Tax=Actinokineospora alba TaxID=504798 RepID=A0A1H0HHJ5_9PSEU|nr:hypothetical protein [Actinokineospora alba]TDP64892.1 hypothetical protein C8E96_0369 [Actinokineospora alba]SDH48561.1 hypothetical protein SAMN05421871_101193 [Actinokineospora alba]SDO18321.1 hypothetical protein SAMN05192558_102110 [Actinokineospora alba]
MTDDTPRFSEDPVQNRARTELLNRLAANTRDPAAAELARELLAGNITPRGVIESGTYDEVLNRGTGKFVNWYSELSEKDKDEAVARGEQAARELAQDPEPSPTSRPVRRRGSSEDDGEDFSERSWIRGR